MEDIDEKWNDGFNLLDPYGRNREISQKQKDERRENEGEYQEILS